MTAVTATAALSPTRGMTVPVEPQRQRNPVFSELVDMANPLQQVPGIGQAYRSMTGDRISVGAQLAGKVVAGAAIAGPVGAAAGAGLFVLEQVIPSVFNFIGRIFSGGEGSTRPAAQPRAVLPAGTQEATAAAVRRDGPVARIEPKSFGIAASQSAASGPVGRRPGAAAPTAAPQLSLEQMSVLMNAFNTGPARASGAAANAPRSNPAPAQAQAPASSAAPVAAGEGPEAFAARMQRNLEKYQMLQQTPR